MKKIIYKVLTFSLLIIAFSGCEKEEEVKSVADTDVLFSYAADNYHVDFTNESSISGTYLWDFGDGSTSTDENPSHDYSSKGDYYVILNVTPSNGDTQSIFTKIKIDKSSDIDLDDNSFADWANITPAYTLNPDLEHGIVQELKYDYDSEFIYLYLKVDTPEDTSFQVFDMLIDIDPSATTGFEYNIWPEFGGGEILIENGFSADRVNNEDYFMDFANYDPNGTDWDTTWIYDEGNTADAQIDGTYLVTGSVIEIEFAISRTKIDALVDKDIIKIAGWTSNPDWDENGWFPGKMPDNAGPNTPSADGLIINMQ
jgi:PKD repeat protein